MLRFADSVIYASGKDKAAEVYYISDDYSQNVKRQYYYINFYPFNRYLPHVYLGGSENDPDVWRRKNESLNENRFPERPVLDDE